MKQFFCKLLFIILIFITFPLIVYADDEIESALSIDADFLESIESSSSISDIPEINAKHAIIFDRSSKQILYGKEETEKCKMASTTKIMTSIVVLENCNLSDMVTVSSNASGTGGSRLGLSTGDEVSVENLLYGLLLRSGNDAAVALAEHVAGSIENFAILMNQKGLDLNLTLTHFVTPHGLDNDDHYTTAYDLACLTDYALQNEIFSKIVKTKTYTIILNGYPKTISNTNELLGNFAGIYGVKTGFTNGANRCLVTACKRGDLDVICVVLGSDTKKQRTQDSIKLLNYTFNNFTVVNIEDFIDRKFEEWYLLHVNCFTIDKGKSQILNLYLNKDNLPFTHMAIHNSSINNINTSISFTSYYEAPIAENTLIGTLSLKIDEKKYFSIEIMNSNKISKKYIYDYFSFLLKNLQWF